MAFVGGPAVADLAAGVMADPATARRARELATMTDHWTTLSDAVGAVLHAV